MTMNKSLLSAAALAALVVASPASAQILGGGGLGGGGLGGSVGGTLGGTIDRGPSTIETTTRIRDSARIDRNLPRRGARGVVGEVTGDASIDNATRLGEERIVTRQSAAADGRLSLDQRMLHTRGVAAATRKGLRRVSPTASGVQVFVPPVALPGPMLPRTVVDAYPAYGGYYYDPGAVFVGSRYVDVYMDRQEDDLEVALQGTGATVRRRGNDLIVTMPADVTFAFDKSDIRSRFYGPLNAFARTMLNYPGTDVEVVGHTDAVGSDAYNVSLSERRGRAVADYLVAQDAEPSRLVVEGMGESEPIASNATVEGRAANRRVELIVHPRAG
jgi:outer membrane protein OmpA-like peptidoglycan-associated protein